ncbi:MAG: AAC(3) family N-acetyltransferase [Acidobacteria bacterium]|nr:AAC(3) family N-acetyltransferase [Acidobacteriota bacterium]
MALSWTATALSDDLGRLGVSAGDIVMVHASLRKIGPIDGGAHGVIAALDGALGPEGTWLMVLGADDDWHWANDLPEEDRADLLAEAEPFDPLLTPAEEDMGVMAEVFRTTPGTLVSDHPEGRFGARGRRAAEFVRDVPWNDYYGPGSPLGRLVEAGGSVLRLGADTDTVTLLHYAEYLAHVRDKQRVRRHRKVLGADGPEIRVVECLDDTLGIVDWPGEDYFSLIIAGYLAVHPEARGTVGDAPSELLDARELVDFAARWMTRHFRAAT